MKKAFFTILLILLTATIVQAQNIEYGYNMFGEYVPISIDGEKIEYGYNIQGEHVPVSIGGREIQYGYNMQGQYVITGIENSEQEYNQTRTYSRENFNRCRYAIGIAGWSGNRNYMNMCR